MIQIKNTTITYDDDATWKLLQSGNTCGVFQLEKQYVQKVLRQIKPANLWELSAVLSIIRPGPLRSGYVDIYVNNKNNPEQVESYGHPIVDNILKSTHMVGLYQESIMLIAGKLAWSHLPHLERLIKIDTLRKAIGKKDQNKIMSIGREFMEGCLHNGASQEVTDKLFEFIKNAGRYAFNLSHSIKYADVAYTTAYLKAHHPLEFYTTYLSFCKYKSLYKWEEIHILTNEAKLFNIQVLAPNINKKNINFAIEDGNIRFGLAHIKYVSESFCEKLGSLPEIKDWRQFVILTMSDQFGVRPNKNITEALIKTGAFVDLGLTRKSLMTVFEFLSELTDKELRILLEHIHECPNIYELGSFTLNLITNKKRLEKIKSLITFISPDEFDHPEFISQFEKDYLGVVITATAIDLKGCESFDKCIECLGDVPNYKEKRVAGIIDTIYFTTVKNGKNAGRKMARIDIHDSSGELKNIPIFADLYDSSSDLLIEKNTILVDMYKRDSGWIANNIQQL